jgi:hypothetical protein
MIIDARVVPVVPVLVVSVSVSEVGSGSLGPGISMYDWDAMHNILLAAVIKIENRSRTKCKSDCNTAWLFSF